MSVELRPLSVRCNIACQYCYQHPQRDAGNQPGRYDLDAMKAAVLEIGGPFTLFGGEPLLVAEADLEELWAWGLEQFGENGVQTNGSLINDNHIRMFKQYRVSVGVSIDGPGPLNDARWVETVEKTRQATARTEAAIRRLCEEGVPPSLIVTLHRANATADKLPVMHAWLRSLSSLGVDSVRLHILEVESPLIREKYALSDEENIHAFLSFAELQEELRTLSFDVFQDIDCLLRGNDTAATCVWRACDPYTTRAVEGVEGMGQRSNCGRTNKDGIDFVKSDRYGFERYMALYHTPQEHGGCQGCRFFSMCKGECPGTSMEADWRNRSEHCAIWKALFRHQEDRLLDAGVIPVSAHPRRRALEEAMVEAWARGSNPCIEDLLYDGVAGDESRPRGPHPGGGETRSSHGDFTDHGDA